MASRFLDFATNIRRLASIERAAGYVLAAFGALCFVMWWTGRTQDRHGMVFAFIGGMFVLPLGILLALAGLTLAEDRRSLWLLQLPMLAWPWIFNRWFLH